VLLAASLLPGCAHKPQPPTGALVLDAADPVISVEIEGVPLRLRVDLDQQDTIELNPAAAARLTLPWEGGETLNVGRVQLRSRTAHATLRVGARDLPTQVAEHGVDCCAGVDGAVGPDLLPFATVHWRRADAPQSTVARSFPLEEDSRFGLSAPSGVAGVRLRVAFAQTETIGTAAAGAILLQRDGGHWDGEPKRVTLAFGIARPARTIAFQRPVELAGFRFDHLLLRISDFAGDKPLPKDAVDTREVLIVRRLQPQLAWPAILLGKDRLSRCAEVTYTAAPRTLTLRCAFDSP
jgi:hypothetical protein